jgi:hypothetical protein
MSSMSVKKEKKNLQSLMKCRHLAGAYAEKYYIFKLVS